MVNSRQSGCRARGDVVLTLFGLFGVLMAGVAADVVLAPDGRSAEDGPEADGQGERLTTDDSFLDEVATLDGLPLSDDIPDPMDDDLDLVGTDAGEVMSGGQGHDQISGLEGADLIDARGGDDLVDAGAGGDAVQAGDGDDTVTGGKGDDSIYGQAGEDLLLGDAGDDWLAGHEGADTLAGAAGDDALIGGEGDDSLDGGAGRDWLAGGMGHDTLAGGAGADVIDGNAGDDRLSGLAGKGDDFATDYLNGGAGDDTLVLGSGDHASGGDGEDDFVLHDWLTEGGVAHISDYDVSRDQLIVMYDPVAHPDPALTLEVTEDGRETTVLLNGSPVATVQGSAVLLKDIVLTAA